MKLGLDEEIFSPCIDLVFKAMFTQDTPDSKGALMDFLSSIIGKPVADVQIQGSELPVDGMGEKQSIMDLHCVFNDGEHANVEIQVRNRGDMCVRAEYNMCKLHGKQSLKGLDYSDLKPTYQISIVDFTLFPDDNLFFDELMYRSRSGRQLDGGRTHIYFIELTKLAGLMQKSVEELTRPEMWAIFFKYVDNTKQRERINNLIQKEEGLAMASTILQQIAKDDEMRIQIFSREKAEMDRVSEINYAVRKGIEEERNDVAKAFLAEGVPLEVVAKATHMSIEDIKKLVQ